ncbi:hypothetical protein D3C78_20560 [compost metagenome]
MNVEKFCDYLVSLGADRDTIWRTSSPDATRYAWSRVQNPSPTESVKEYSFAIEGVHTFRGLEYGSHYICTDDEKVVKRLGRKILGLPIPDEVLIVKADHPSNYFDQDANILYIPTRCIYQLTNDVLHLISWDEHLDKYHHLYSVNFGKSPALLPSAEWMSDAALGDMYLNPFNIKYQDSIIIQNAPSQHFQGNCVWQNDQIMYLKVHGAWIRTSSKWAIDAKHQLPPDIQEELALLSSYGQ